MPRGARSVLAEVLALADTRAPGQLASMEQRRHHVAGKTRQALQWTGLLMALAITAALVLQGRGCWPMGAGPAMAAASGPKEGEAQALRAKLAASGTNVALLRLAMQVQQSQLQGGVALTEPLWLLGQLMQNHPQADLQRTEMALLPQARRAAQGPRQRHLLHRKPPGRQRCLAHRMVFRDRAPARISPRERQALLDGLAASVQAWPGWKVQTNPVRAERRRHRGRSGGRHRATARWRWCLVPSAEAQEMLTDGSEGGGT